MHKIIVVCTLTKKKLMLCKWKAKLSETLFSDISLLSTKTLNLFLCLLSRIGNLSLHEMEDGKFPVY